MIFDILALISTLMFITLLKRLVNIFPSIASCMTRWKENVNIEASVKNSYDRNMIALAMVIPFCLTVERFRLYDLPFMEGMGENLRIATVFGIFAAYFLIRFLAYLMVHTRKGRKKTYDIAYRSSFTFFIVLTLSLVTTGGILSFIGIDNGIIRSAMLWISAVIYTFFLLRKTQIFISSFSIFTSFLYLCALEIIPTGILIAPVLIF